MWPPWRSNLKVRAVAPSPVDNVSNAVTQAETLFGQVALAVFSRPFVQLSEERSRPKSRTLQSAAYTDRGHLSVMRISQLRTMRQKVSSNPVT